ncbi:hypothetical protein C8R42DRAFT_313088 [Lentinula raphanica]|nr:hypothetical protein C8R42DRAFT_313088 [Lentinula raphanica]
MSSEFVQLANLPLIVGPTVLGGMFSYGLFGMLIVQLFLYQFDTRDQDPTWLRVFVSVLALSELVNMIVTTIFMWEVLAQHWGDPLILLSVDSLASKTLAGIPLLSGIVATMAHSFFSWRIHRLTGSSLIPTIVMLISLTTCAMAGYCGIRAAHIGIFRLTELDVEVTIWLGGSTLCDLIISAVLVFKLLYQQKRAMSFQTRHQIHHLIALTVETSLVTTLTALFALALFILLHNDDMFFAPLLILSQVYSNCLLATLNSRTVLNKVASSGHPLWVDLDRSRTTTSLLHTYE